MLGCTCHCGLDNVFAFLGFVAAPGSHGLGLFSRLLAGFPLGGSGHFFLLLAGFLELESRSGPIGFDFFLCLFANFTF